MGNTERKEKYDIYTKLARSNDKYGKPKLPRSKTSIQHLPPSRVPSILIFSALNWARICQRLRSPGIDSQPGGPVRQPYLTHRPARLHRLAESIPWIRFLRSLKGLQIRALICFIWSNICWWNNGAVCCERESLWLSPTMACSIKMAGSWWISAGACGRGPYG